MITIHLPAILATEFRMDTAQRVEAQTCEEAFASLDLRHPGMSSWIMEPDGRFREHLSVFVSGRRLAPRTHASVSVKDGSEVWILHAISGG